MKYRVLIISCLFFSSCSVFYPEGIVFSLPNYNYNYRTFNKKLDYNDKNYLLNPTSFDKSNFKNGYYLKNIVKFFKDKLGDNVIKNKDYKDSEGKLIIPFNIYSVVLLGSISFINLSASLISLCFK